MKLIFHIKSLSEYKRLTELGANLFCVSVEGFSSRSGMALDSFNNLLGQAVKRGQKIQLDWDLLLTQNQLIEGIEHFSKIKYSDLWSVRALDLGVINWLQRSYGQLALTILLNGSHNERSLTVLLGSFKRRPESIAVSKELPLDKLKQFTKFKQFPIELLGVGPLQLFITPRKLLSPLNQKKQQQNHLYRASSEESAHQGFYLQENPYGTIMDNMKDYYLLDSWEELLDLGVDYLRIDLRHLGHEESIDFMSRLNPIINQPFQTSPKYLKELKQAYPRKTTRGFLKVNKTDVLFKKLKNHRLQNRGPDFIGEVVDTHPNKKMAIWTKKNEVSVGDELKIITPEGKAKRLVLGQLFDLGHRPIEKSERNQVVLVRSVKGVSIKSMIYLEKKKGVELPDYPTP